MSGQSRKNTSGGDSIGPSLKAYLRGKVSLKEFNSNGINPISMGSPVSPKQERMAEAWQDLMVQLEALWLDVLNSDEDVYEEALPALQELRGMNPESSQSAVTLFQSLAYVLSKHADEDAIAGDKDMSLYFSRMEYLIGELEYVNDQHNPDVHRVPGAPIQSKDDWMDQRDQAPARKSPEEEVPKMGTASPEHAEIGKDQAGPNRADPEGDEDTGIDDSPAVPGAAEKGQPDGDATPTQDDQPQSGEDSPEGEEDTGELEGGDREVGSDDDWEDQFRSSVDDKEDSEDWEDQFKAGIEDEPEESPDEEDKPPAKKRLPFRRESVESVPSIVGQSFVRMAGSLSEGLDVDDEVASTAEALQACMEVFTDCSSVAVTIGEGTPGNPSSICFDVYAEWAGKGGGFAPGYGFARVSYSPEGPSLGIVNEAGECQDFFVLDGKATDSDLAEYIYSRMEEVIDAGDLRVSTESRLLPTLYSLIERVRNGSPVSQMAWSQAISTLRSRIGMQDGVRVVGSLINPRMEESYGGFMAHYDWAVPCDCAPLKDLDLDSDNSPAEWPLSKEDTLGIASDDSGDGELKEGKNYSTYWRTPTIRVSVKEGAVYLKHEDGSEEVLPQDMKDEDVAARLASMAYQKEGIDTGKVIERNPSYMTRSEVMDHANKSEAAGNLGSRN